MRVTITPEQKWVLGALSVALLAALPSFFMKTSSARSSTGLGVSPGQTLQASGGAVPILESAWTPRAMSGDEQATLHEALKVDLNHADEETLNSLPNVGTATAQRIIEYREDNGCFQRIEDIRNVKGLGGDAKFDALKDHIRIDLTGCGSAPARKADDESDRPSRKKSSKSSKKSAPAGMVNINTASAEELDALPGIGKTTAARIIKYREDNGPFGSIEEIMEVQGIKEGTFEKIKDLIKTY